MDLKQKIQHYQDFPETGVSFKDISPLLSEHFDVVISRMVDLFPESFWEEIDYIAGIEARGFSIAAGIAAATKKNIMHIRKAGKLPGEVCSTSYNLEYGTAKIEMHRGRGRMLIVDDVLATGGTLKAASQLAEEAGYDVVALAVVVNLAFLNNLTWDGKQIPNLIEYTS